MTHFIHQMTTPTIDEGERRDFNMDSTKFAKTPGSYDVWGWVGRVVSGFGGMVSRVGGVVSKVGGVMSGVEDLDCG